MAKIAVTGASGFVGSNIAEVLASFGHEVIGLVRSVQEKNLPWAQVQTDFDSAESIAHAAEGVDAIVHCAISNDFNRLLDDREYAYDSFVGLTSRVAKACNILQAHHVFISTDWVMDGTGHAEPESNPGNPVNFYGVLKALSEQVVRDLNPDNGATARIAGVMGQHRAKAEAPRSQDVGFGYFVVSLVREISAGREFTVWGGDYVNKITTPSLAAEIGAQIERVILRNATGTLHLVGDDSISRMDLAMLVCEVFELDATMLREADAPVEERFPAPVPVDSSLDNGHTKQVLGLGATPLRELLQAFRVELETGNITTVTKPEN